MNDAEHATFERALDTWGPDAQLEMLIEECAELIVALRHLARSNGALTRAQDSDAYAAAEVRHQKAWNEVIGEVADVDILVDQARLVFGEANVDAARAAKVERLRGRLADPGRHFSRPEATP